MLDLVVEHCHEGRSPAEIVDSFPTLRLADVYSAIGYYLRHPAEIQKYLDEGEKLAQSGAPRATPIHGIEPSGRGWIKP